MVLRSFWQFLFFIPFETVKEWLVDLRYEMQRIHCSKVYYPFFFILWCLALVSFKKQLFPSTFRMFYQQICLKFPHVNFATFNLSDLIKVPIQVFYLCFINSASGQSSEEVRKKEKKIEKKKEKIFDWYKWATFKIMYPVDKLLELFGLQFFYNEKKKRFRILRIKSIRYGFYGLILLLTIWVIVVPLEPVGQLIFSLILWIFAIILRSTAGRVATLAMMIMSIIMSSRYLWWRITSTLNVDDTLGYVLGVGLLLAEFYTWLILVLGFIQTAWPLRREVAQLPLDSQTWPSVDIYIPTYNEPLKVLIPTVFASQNIDWPSDRLNIYVLDDGKRPEIQAFCEQNDVNYIIRPDNSFAKAGNLNHAMTKTTGDFIAIFDCDHVPVRSFLQLTMGGFMKDERLSLVQTPHYFFSPDPFERNLDVFNKEPNEGDLFYGQIQDGNDLWNATFFCGSCAVLRRTALEEVGGVATETVTEDAHTALKMHRLGYNTSYVNVKQAAGLATESISAHIGQRIRWARGMLQIFRVDNPLFGKGLSFMQRICYSNAMLHFFYGLPRLVFLTAPLAFLILHTYIIYAPVELIFLYVIPAIFHVNLTNSRHQGRHRNTFWAELYETVLAWYIFRPTLVALISPKKGKFNVTEKGGLVDKDYFDWGIGVPYILLIVLNLVGMGFGIYQLQYGLEIERNSVLMNMAWVVYNLIILGGVMAVITETKQVRQAHRIEYTLPLSVVDEKGYVYEAEMKDYSESGIGLHLIDSPNKIDLNDKLTIILQRDHIVKAFDVNVKFASRNFIGAQFVDDSYANLKTLIQLTFSRADAWEVKTLRRDKEIISSRLVSIFKIGMTGYKSFIYYFIKMVQTRLPLIYYFFCYLGSFLPKKPIELDN